jgi:pimeloyl-ACP methyl ester carboxylesterase
MVGNSLGGAYTATYGVKYPDKILTLALWDTAGAPSDKKSDFIVQMEKGKNLLLADNAEDYNKLMDLIFVKRPVMPSSFKKIIFEDWVAHKEFNKKIWNDWSPSQYSLMPILPQIQTPVLIVWGDQDKMLNVEGAAILGRNLKNSITVIMTNTGHCPMIEKPEEAAIVYENFLRKKR